MQPAIFGNYHGYYTKRPSLNDPRLARLPPDFFRDKTVLDVGCNDGAVTCEIAQSWGARRVLGVDIDPTLVRHAWKRRRTLFSLSAGRDADFPLSCVHAHGPLSIPPAAAAADVDAFPHNVAFRTADWSTDDPVDAGATYDVVLAFSITKWIHLHHGDDGLAAFFRRIHRVLRPGGALVLEPQPWSSYAGARRRMDPQLRENAAQLQLRPEDFPALLADVGFGPPQHLGTTGEGGNDPSTLSLFAHQAMPGFHRPIDLYLKLDTAVQITE